MEKRNSEMNTHHVWQCPFIEDTRDAFEVGVGEDGKTRISIDIPEGCFMEVSTGIGPDGCQTDWFSFQGGISDWWKSKHRAKNRDLCRCPDTDCYRD